MGSEAAADQDDVNRTSVAGQRTRVPSGKKGEMPGRIPRLRPSSRRIENCNFMLMGDSGIGKTTFLNNLWSVLTSGKVIIESGQKQRKTTHVTEWRHHEEREDHDIYFRAIDTVGLGEHTDLTVTAAVPIQIIKDRIIQQYYTKNMLPNETLLDPKIHCVLYFIQPGRNKPSDITFMKEASEFTNVIPIIGKADALTKEELTQQRKDLTQKLKENNVKIFGGPFVVLSTDRKYAQVNAHWKLEDKKHNDFSHLRKLIFDKRPALIKANDRKATDKILSGELAADPFHRPTIIALWFIVLVMSAFLVLKVYGFVWSLVCDLNSLSQLMIKVFLSLSFPVLVISTAYRPFLFLKKQLLPKKAPDWDLIYSPYYYDMEFERKSSFGEYPKKRELQPTKWPLKKISFVSIASAKLTMIVAFCYGALFFATFVVAFIGLDRLRGINEARRLP